ncbi:hypothetical protein LCM16_02470 [Mameliella alba]|nr:hypothetical protein [Mameliella alba]
MADKLMQMAMRMEARAQAEEAEADRIGAVMSRGYVPEDCGPEIPHAPARGPVQAIDFHASYPKGDGGFESKPAGFQGRKTLRLADAFDVMVVRAQRHKKPAPFTPGQVAMGRFYRDLVERHATAGVRCSSLESLAQSGGGSGGEFMDAVLRDRQRIEVLRNRIGTGAALSVRKVRPSSRGQRGLITDRRLVDSVCLEDLTLSEVLRAHGWAREGQSVSGKYVRLLQEVLSASLERMMGPIGLHGRMVVHFGSGPGSIWD